MMEFGNTLRTAREAKGFTQAQIAEMTRMAPATVADLESENFGRIAAPIYGRGFVKLYCEAVGIDPKPLIAEFMAIYNGEHETGIRERRQSDIPKRAEPSRDPQTALSAVPPDQPDETQPVRSALRPETELKPPRIELPPRHEQPVASESLRAAQAESAAAEPQVSRYAAPMRHEHERGPVVPPAFWRICALVAVSVAMFCGIVAGVRALYLATTSKKPSAATEDAARTAGSAKDDRTAAKPETQGRPAVDIRRESQKVPSLYID